MKGNIRTECDVIMDAVYDSDKNDSISLFSLFLRLRIWLHLLLCPSCAGELRNLKRIEEVMRTDFLPSPPCFDGTAIEDMVMERILEENFIQEQEETDASVGFSLRSWVIIGFFLLLSLSSSFFGGNFVEIANTEGSSFLLPVGITVGLAVTCYGALFIGSHLKELSSRFRLR